jgi:type I restriction enzyme M protein
MLAPQLRQQIFGLWTAFWSSGMTNPITAIEQITYLLFLKQIEQQDAQHVKNGKRSLYDSDTDPLRWSQLEKASDPYARLTLEIFPWLRGLGAKIKERWGDASADGLEVAEYLEDAFFQLPKEKTATLTLAIKSVNSLFDSTGSQNSDLMGDIFEYLLDQLSTSGKNGQFRTPRQPTTIQIKLEMLTSGFASMYAVSICASCNLPLMSSLTPCQYV